MHPDYNALVRRLVPGGTLVSVEPLSPDAGATANATGKAAGYGEPVRLVTADREGRPHQFVFRVAGANEFGHDRRSDRAAETLLAYDGFSEIPNHVVPVDVGAVHSSGRLVSLTDTRELYLVTTYAPGTVYADDLRRLARGEPVSEQDLQRLEALAVYLTDLHIPIANGEHRYRRAIRDLVGSGEGIFGIVDGYPADVPGAPLDRLLAIEASCASWRWRLRDRTDRLARTHGDFHPFNIVFDNLAPTFLDSSRGGCGDPADDITALAINFVLFAIDARESWKGGLGMLWQRWWQTCSALRPDPELLHVVPPFFAWRALVVCNPRFYPNLSAEARGALLELAERALDAGHLDPAWAENLFP